jgi:Cu2+-exporting ATPase
MNPVAATACPHCATQVEGPPGTFCCHGCEAAHALLSDAGLEGWYTTRQQPAPRSNVATGVDWSSLPVQQLADGAQACVLQIDGLRCASCVWVTERLLERSPGVQRASVSFATGRATLQWDPQRTTLGDLADRIATLGYAPRPSGGASGAVDRDLLIRAGVAAFGAMNVMGLDAALYVGWVDGMDERFAQLMRWLGLLVTTPVALWSAIPFYQGARAGLRAGTIHMDTPIAIAIAGMYAHGVWATLAHTDAWLDSLAMLVTLLLIGRALEARGRRRTAEAAATLAASTPRHARRVADGAIEVVPTASLRAGDHIELGAGDDVPADGIVIFGEAQVRMALLTGESEPTPARVGDRLVAGAAVDQGAVRMAVTNTGDGTLIAAMARQLELADAEPRTPTPADRLAPWFTGGTLIVAALLLAWFGGQGQLDVALDRAVAVLVVACPCALALSRPLIGAAGLASAARRGLLLRSVDALERLATVDVIVLDKTGTATGGRPVVVGADDDALRVAAGLERSSRHPIALAILDAAAARGLAIPEAHDIREVAGRGISGRVDGVVWRVESGGPGAVVVTDGHTTSLIRLRDVPRASLDDDLRALRARAGRLVLLTGDRAAAAEALAGVGRFDEVIAEADPLQKRAFIEQLRHDGRRVLFVGDGVNDSGALAAATVGVAMADGAAPSLAASHGVLATDRLRPLAVGVDVARATDRRMRAALMRSAVYNVAAVIAAVAGFVNPLVAAVLMPLSSGVVLWSAATLDGTIDRRR